MTRTEKPLALATFILLAATTAYGINIDTGSPERNYRVIVDRNPFGLKPPAPPPTNAPVLLPPKDEILLTGITSIGGLRAYFMSKAPQGKVPEYYSLSIDEKKNGLEVIEIDTKGKSVRVRNAGVESVMTFASNGVKPPASPITPPAGGMAGAQHNQAIPTMPGAATAMGTGISAPTVGVPGISTPVSPGSGRVRTIPSRNVRTPTVVNPAVNVNQPPVQPDPNAGVQDVLLMELQKRVNPDVVFPPTPFPQ